MSDVEIYKQGAFFLLLCAMGSWVAFRAFPAFLQLNAELISELRADNLAIAKGQKLFSEALTEQAKILRNVEEQLRLQHETLIRIVGVLERVNIDGVR